MALTHVTAVRNSLAAVISTAVDAGAGAGKIVIGTAGMATTLVTINFGGTTAFGSPSNGTITATGTPLEGTAVAGGTAAAFQVKDSDNNVVFSGTVTAIGGGGDIELSSTTIATSDAVRINSFSYTASA